ncbi:MAG: thiamine phosphate synthase [Cellvibrionales bacterium]|nr:thiamine phosphate synthase [Cellvibrionales bacterium]
MAANPKLTVWSIAGSDNSGGAGIQADSQCFRSFGLAFTNIVTAITAQNTQGVQHIAWITSESFSHQWQSLAKEHVPAAIKIGLIGQAYHFDLLNKLLPSLDAPVVLDPVIKASNGDTLAAAICFKQMLHLVTVFTPNLHEFEAIFADEIQTKGLDNAAKWISQTFDLCLVITGGDAVDEATDRIYYQDQQLKVRSPKQASQHTHGTGCSFSSAIASLLALGYRPMDAVVLAKAYLNQGLALPDQSDTYPAAFQHTGFPNQAACLPAITCNGLPKQLPCAFPQLDKSLGLYVLVENLDELNCCLDSAVDTLQLRIKNGSQEEQRALITQAIALAKARNKPLYINDHWQLAIELDAYGVHLGQEDLTTADLSALQKAGLKLGISTHNVLEIAIAHQYQPSYIAFGPVYSTQSKQVNHPPLNSDHLRQYIHLLKDDYRLTAIGGINTQNAKDVLALGIDSLAVISAVTKSADPTSAISQFSVMMNSLE